jgi:hypothetical protein
LAALTARNLVPVTDFQTLEKRGRLWFVVVAVAEVTLDDINQGIEAFVDPATLFIAPPHFFPALLRFPLDPAFGLAPLFLDYPAQPQNEIAYFGNLSRVLTDLLGVQATDPLHFLEIRPHPGVVPGQKLELPLDTGESFFVSHGHILHLFPCLHIVSESGLLFPSVFVFLAAS